MIYNIALAGYLLGLSRHFVAVCEDSGLMQQIAYQMTSSCLIVLLSLFFSNLMYRERAHDRREPSSCMIVGSGISYHPMKKCRILRENLNKFPAKAIG